MNWFLIALAGPFLWSISCIVDKFLVEKYSKDHQASGALVIYSGIAGLLVAFFIAIFKLNVLDISIIDKLLLIFAGLLSVIWMILYLYALEIEDVSSVAPFMLTIPIFGYILGNIFLGESLTMHQIIGSIIILFGAFLISIDFTGEKTKIKFKPAFYMISASIIVAVMGVIFKFVTIEGNFWASSFWEYLGLGLAGIIMFTFIPKYHKDFFTINKIGGKKIFALNITSELITVIGNLLTNFALLLAPITMVYLVGSFQPVILLFLTIIATKFFPKIISESMHHKVLIPKALAIIIVVAGSVFLFV